MSIPLSLAGKVALISGGSRGIGAASVRMFTAADAKVAFSYRSARPQAEALAKECGPNVCYPIASDLDKPEAAASLVADTVAQMKSQQRTNGPVGHIVLISSTSGQRGEAYHCDYSATKGALISMVKGLSTELASAGIYVNCVAPGWVDTDMSADALKDPKSGEQILRTIPLRRVGRPEEIAAPVLFLCTQHASFITGEVFNVNGGAVLVG